VAGWQLFNVYGPVQDDKKLDFFLKGLQSVVEHFQSPKMLGGDFNLIRRVEEKS
jgi:hypothetical protein